MAEYRSQTIKVSLPQGTAAGTYQFPDVLDTSYTKTTGVTAYVTYDAGQKDFQLGVQDDSTTYCSLAHRSHYEAGIDCPKPLRLTPMAARCSGSKLIVSIRIANVLEIPLEVDMVFTLERPDRAS